MKRKPGEKGFTLLEVLVALAILSVAVTLILQLFSVDLRAISASEDYVLATLRAEAKMREILDDEKLAEKMLTETTADGYRMDISVSDTLKERTGNLPVRLLEIDLTIHWKRGMKEKALTLRTMKAVKRMQLGSMQAAGA